MECVRKRVQTYGIALNRSLIVRSGITQTFCFTVVTPFSDPSDMIEVAVADSCLIQASMEKKKEGKKRQMKANEV